MNLKRKAKKRYRNALWHRWLGETDAVHPSLTARHLTFANREKDVEIDEQRQRSIIGQEAIQAVRGLTNLDIELDANISVWDGLNKTLPFQFIRSFRITTWTPYQLTRARTA